MPYALSNRGAGAGSPRERPQKHRRSGQGFLAASPFPRGQCVDSLQAPPRAPQEGMAPWSLWLPENSMTHPSSTGVFPNTCAGRGGWPRPGRGSSLPAPRPGCGPTPADLAWPPPGRGELGPTAAPGFDRQVSKEMYNRLTKTACHFFPE